MDKFTLAKSSFESFRRWMLDETNSQLNDHQPLELMCSSSGNFSASTFDLMQFSFAHKKINMYSYLHTFNSMQKKRR